MKDVKMPTKQMAVVEMPTDIIATGSLDDLERIIADGLRTFVDVGRALARIRDDKMYTRYGWETFEEYVQANFGMRRSHAYRLIGSAAVVENVSNWGHEPPGNEAQARELAKLPPEQQGEAWDEVVRAAYFHEDGSERVDGAITAKLVADVVKKRLPKKEPERFHITTARSAFVKAARALVEKHAAAWPDDALPQIADMLRDLAADFEQENGLPSAPAEAPKLRVVSNR